MELTSVFEQDGEWVMGYIVEIPGVNTQRRTLDECRENLQDALKEFMLARRERVLREASPRRIAQELTVLERAA